VARERPDWSVGYSAFKTREPTPEERERGAERVILRWQVDEVSPVNRGAGVSTGTHTACCGSCAVELIGTGGKECSTPVEFDDTDWGVDPPDSHTRAVFALLKAKQKERFACCSSCADTFPALPSAEDVDPVLWHESNQPESDEYATVRSFIGYH
jgi:hypothetical protein